jgi:hypothetical protein
VFGRWSACAHDRLLISLFCLLFSLGIYHDMRDRLGACPPEEFDGIVDELTARFAVLSEAERENLLASVPVWYQRHIQTPQQLATAEAKKAEKAAELAAREQCEEEGMCDAGSLWD